jgi:hypothetical protein
MDRVLAFLDAAPEWLKSTLRWWARLIVVGGGAFVDALVRALCQLLSAMTTHPTLLAPGGAPVSAGVARTDTATSTTAPRAQAPADMGSDLTPPDSHGWRFRSGVIQLYRAPAAIRQLEHLATTLSSSVSAPVNVAETQAAVETATRLVQQIDVVDLETAVRTLAAVEAIGTSSLDPLGRTYEAAATAWERGGWPLSDQTGAQAMLDLSVREMGTALRAPNPARARMYASLIGAVASVRHRDVVARLLWFADSVAVPIHRTGLDATDVRTPLTRCVGRWFARVRDAPACSVVDVIHAYWREEIPACLHRDAVEQWVSGALSDLKLRTERDSKGS